MIAIVTATSMEMQAVLALLSHTFITSELENAQAGYISQGFINGIPTCICICGVGPVLSAISTTLLLERYSITNVLLCGIAGTYSAKHLPIGSVVYITEDIYAEYGIRSGMHVCATQFPFFHNSTAGIKEKIILPSPLTILGKMKLEYSVCAEVHAITVAGITGDIATAQHVHKEFPTAEIETMEGFSVALACISSGAGIVHIRSISNEVGIRDGWAMEEALIALSNSIYSIFGGVWI